MKVNIVGGGIGGLTLGLALRQQGIDFQVFEAAAELKLVGAGIVIAINGMQIFQRLGIADQIQKAGYPIKLGQITDEKLSVLSDLEFSFFEKEFKTSSYAIHRAKLQEILAKNLPPGSLHLNKKLKSYSLSSDSVGAQFEDGTHSSSDVLVGADGIHSRVRQQFLPGARLRYSGQTSWRGVLDFRMDERLSDRTIEAWGRNLRFGIVRIDHEKVYWFAVACAPLGEKDEPMGTKRHLTELFQLFHPLINEIIQKTPESAIIRADISDLTHLKSWHQDRVVLLGDAAHATTPNLGQGGNQAIEDALCLALEIKKAKDFTEAFSSFEKLRKPKAQYVVNTSWRLGQAAHLNQSVLVALRNRLLKMTPRSVSRKQLERLFRLNF